MEHVQGFPVWRLQEGSLRPGGRMCRNTVWLLSGDAAPHQVQDAFSIPGLLSQSHKRARFTQEIGATEAPSPLLRHKKQKIGREEEENTRFLQGDRAAEPENLPFRLRKQQKHVGTEKQEFGAQSLLFDAEKENIPPFRAAGGSLFQTGTGKSVQVSSTSMKRALALLGEGTNAAKECNVGSAERNNTLFQTATGKAVPISASALSKAKALLQDAHIDDGNDEENYVTPQKKRDAGLSFGFSTASNLRKVPATVPPFKRPRRRSFTSPLTDIAPRNRFTSPLRGVIPNQLQERLNSSANSPLANEKNIRTELCVLPGEKELKMPPRPTLQEFFHNRPNNGKDFAYSKRDIQLMTSDDAKEYMFVSGRDRYPVGASEMRNMLIEAGAKSHLATTEWVENHYRWIVWKLACQERSYPRKAQGFLTQSNVLRELKYRYIKEVGFGHRSIIRKICERDASAARTMVLCVSAIREKHEESARVEVTDGWYCLDAILDAPLARQLQAGKLFVGQKLQISEAVLIGGVGGLPPLEAFSVVNLVVHINGTYRAHWSERLGACRKRCLPLAFRCIKPDGGIVPWTCVGITRIYPLLYRERVKGGLHVLRTERAEHAAQLSFEQRRASVAEGVMSILQRDDRSSDEDYPEEECVKLFKSLECAADPEVVLADMTVEDHTALSAYQAKRQMRRQVVLEKRVQEALEEANLETRDVVRLFKVRVAGLGSDCITNDGLITVWDPSESLINELVEGHTYVVNNIKPYPVLQKGTLHLSAGKSSMWRKLSAQTFQYNPRAAIQLQNLDEVPTHSEFDASALILHVGQVYESGDHRRQWIFVSDGSPHQGQEASLLAIDFSAPSDTFAQFEPAYSGTVVGFCNLIKLQPDERNSMWVAEATNLTVYSSKLNTRPFLHLSKSAALITRWAKSSPQTVTCLRKRIEDILSYV